MKKVYHFCLSAGECGVLCRTDEDYRYLVNCLGLAGYMTGSLLLAYCVMSNHVHCCVRTDDVAGFIKRWRYSYTRYFNEKYRRKGRLGGGHNKRKGGGKESGVSDKKKPDGHQEKREKEHAHSD